MSFSYSNSTSCIRSDNLDLIEQAIISVLEQEGCRPISKPPLPQNSLPLIQKLRSCPYKIDSYLWVIGLFAGKLGWTIIETSFNELFCRRAKGATKPRLSKLAKQSKCDAFHLSVYELLWGALLEANALGKVFVSGDLDCYKIEDMKFHDEPVLKRTGSPNFCLLNVSEELKTVIGKRVNYKEREKRLKQLAPLCHLEKEQGDKARSEKEDLEKSSWEIADRALGQLLVSPSNFWNYWYEVDNLLYKAYAEPEQLEKDGVKLLFFQVGRFDLNPETEEIWSPITSREDYGKESWQDIPF